MGEMGELASMVAKIPERELLAYQAKLRSDIFRMIRERLNGLKSEGFTQAIMAKQLDIDEGQLSRLLKGDVNLTLETLSDLARGVGCVIEVSLLEIKAN